MPSLLESARTAARTEDADSAGSSRSGACFHCGSPCGSAAVLRDGKPYCCQGCVLVHDLLQESGLGQFYDLGPHPGVRAGGPVGRDRWAYLDTAELQQQLLDFTDGKTSRVTFHVPAIHCVACVWLLENLFRLEPGIGRSQVNFPRREVSITFDPAQVQLSGVVALLSGLGYEPQLTLGSLGKATPDGEGRRRALQVGIAGFAFGNIMLFSLPAYLGLDRLNGPLFHVLFGYLSLALALPVLIYCAADYWQSAFLSFRQRTLTLDVPIALGLAALYAQSTWEILSGTGEGYLDSLSGLVFFLLWGRVFQQKTHERLAFDRDYRSFFPLAVLRKTAAGEERMVLSQLCVGDHLVLRNGELIPADARLLAGPACIDYSFVTGESEPVERRPGDLLYAGGQQIGSAIEVETVRPVSQSYLTALWNNETFRKQREDDLHTLTNRYSRRFTAVVLGVALGAAACWIALGQSGRALKSFTSVLIVACPCALALAAPFTLGTAQRWLARARVYLKNSLVLERIARIDTIVFDKTGTLTASTRRGVTFHGAALSAAEAAQVGSLARQSNHPLAVRLGDTLAQDEPPESVAAFQETPGQGIAGRTAGAFLLLGSQGFLAEQGITVPEVDIPAGSAVWLGVDGRFRGVFVIANPLRPDADRLLQTLDRRYDLALLSGDNAREQARFRDLFGQDHRLHFNQSPLDKLGFIRDLQAAGRTVMMVGDGLNDAGALRQSDVGVAVVEQVGSFSPASDVILEASQVPQIAEILHYAAVATRIVRLGFAVSAVYNAVGISIAAAGWLSPVLCAILMPLSSVTVVGFACVAATWAARRTGLDFELEQSAKSR